MRIALPEQRSFFQLSFTYSEQLLHRDGLQRCFAFEQVGKNSLLLLTGSDLKIVQRIRIVMKMFIWKTKS